MLDRGEQRQVLTPELLHAFTDFVGCHLPPDVGHVDLVDVERCLQDLDNSIAHFHAGREALDVLHQWP